jgi:hypothetical protein
MNRCINPAGVCAKGSGGICFSSQPCEHQHAGEVERKELQAAWETLRESLSVLDKETLEKIEPVLKKAIFRE